MNAFIVISAAILLTLTFAAPLAADKFEDAISAYKGGDYATALPLFRSLAEQGDGDGQKNLGLMYYNGQGVPQDCFALLLSRAMPKVKLCLVLATARGWAYRKTM